MTPTDLESAECWAGLERELAERTGLTVVVFDADNARVTDTETWANELCPLIKGHPDSASQICAMAQQSMIAMAKVTGEPVVEECDAGMVKIVVPMLLDGDLVGSVSGCGCLLEGSEIEDEYVAQSARSPVREVRVRSATVGGLTMEEAQGRARIMAERVGEIVSRHAAN